METDKLLNAILNATRRGSLKWRQLGPGEFKATGPIRVKISQLTPMLAGDTDTAGPQAFQVESEGLCMAFWDGSVGCKIIREILSTGLAQWSDHENEIEKRMTKLLKRLKTDR